MVKVLGFHFGRFFHGFGADDRGTTAIEYGLISSGVALMIVATIGVLGKAVLAHYLAVLAGLS